MEGVDYYDCESFYMRGKPKTLKKVWKEKIFTISPSLEIQSLSQQQEQQQQDSFEIVSKMVSFLFGWDNSIFTANCDWIKEVLYNHSNGCKEVIYDNIFGELSNAEILSLGLTNKAMNDIMSTYYVDVTLPGVVKAQSTYNKNLKKQIELLYPNSDHDQKRLYSLYRLNFKDKTTVMMGLTRVSFIN